MSAERKERVKEKRVENKGARTISALGNADNSEDLDLSDEQSGIEEDTSEDEVINEYDLSRQLLFFFRRDLIGFTLPIHFLH